MSWKYRFGQIIGIFIGVTTGMFLVDLALYKLRGSPPPPPQADYQQYPQYQQPQGTVFDQAVANVQVAPNRAGNAL